MAYANRTEAQEAMRRAQAATTFSSWAERKAFNDKWNAIVQAATIPEPSSPYNTKFTNAERQAYDNRRNAKAAKAYANPSYPDPGPPPAVANPLTGVTATYESRIKEMQDLIAQQTADFQSQQQQMMDGLAAQQASYQKQAQQTANAQRAYTPAPEATANETNTTGSSPNARRVARGGLSSLAIIEGLGTNANPLSGLQLA